jgi:hypothetical protein
MLLSILWISGTAMRARGSETAKEPAKLLSQMRKNPDTKPTLISIRTSDIKKDITKPIVMLMMIPKIVLVTFIAVLLCWKKIYPLIKLVDTKFVFTNFWVKKLTPKFI